MKTTPIGQAVLVGRQQQSGCAFFLSKAFLSLMIFAFALVSSHATLLYQDATYYPYTNGPIQGQGLWFTYATKYSATNPLDAFVTNDVIYLNATNSDSVGTPTNGWSNPGTITWASFSLNLPTPPAAANYFVEFRDTNGNTVCHLYDTTAGTTVPGTYRLGIGNFGSSAYNVYPQDLVTGITYTIVVAYDTSVGSATEGANLLINPSYQDYTNLEEEDYTGPGIGVGFAFGSDTTTSTNLLNIKVNYIGFSPYATAGISNVIAGTDFTNVETTLPTVIGVQPQSGTNYSGNPVTFYTFASGVDLTYHWFDNYGPLTDDGVTISGSSSNALTVLSVTNSDSYYVIITDAYGNQVTSATAYDTVITTPTAPFFSTNLVAVNLTNNLFTGAQITDTALGTGPLTYQWYFAPTNTPGTYSAVSGQTAPTLSIFLSDYTSIGKYYVQVSSSLGTADGPTNFITELAPLQASILQLHNFMVAERSQIKNSATLYINSNNVTVSGYVTTYGGFGSPSTSSGYSEFFIQDTNGYGVEVYIGNDLGNTNTPPVGSFATVTAPVEVYDTGLEMYCTNLQQVVTNPAPAFALRPVLANSIFNDLATNGLGTNALLIQGSLITFTNVYFYGKKLPTNPPVATFYSNSYTTAYFNINGTTFSGTNTIEDYQFGYNYGQPSAANYYTNAFNGQPFPTNVYQLTGVYYTYNSGPELLPSRLADYVTNTPVVSARYARSASVGTVTVLTPQTGSTYSVYGATNLFGPWTLKAYGQGYYPTNVTVVDTNTASAGFYKVTSP